MLFESRPLLNTKRTRAAIKAFQAADLGVVDAFEALELACAKVPLIDRERVYAVGHSSAGTLALQIASSTNRIRACVAYAPVCDVEGFLGEDSLAMIESWVPGTAAIMRRGSPINQTKLIRVPVFLFHAMDDSVVEPRTVIAFRDELARERGRIRYLVATSGGHYEPMLRVGIPDAIKWLKKMDAEAAR